jgi:hypothetical protein
MSELTPIEHPLLRRLSFKLLQKADRARAAVGTSLKLDATNAPELFNLDSPDGIDLHERLLQSLAATGWVRLKLSAPKRFQSFVDRGPTLELLDECALSRWAEFTPRRERWDRKLVAELRARAAISAQNLAVSGVNLTELAQHLSSSPLSALETLESEAAVALLDALAQRCQVGEAMPVRKLSSMIFGGRSKVLDRRVELLRILGAQEDQFFESPIQLLVDAPTDFHDVILVENQLTYERMADGREAAWLHSALVFASGFKGSAKRIRAKGGARLYLRAGQSSAALAQDIERWRIGADEKPVFFFGDLDYSGMDILRSLRRCFTHAQAWQPGYDALLGALSKEISHTAASAMKERQRDPEQTGCTYADTVLLPAIRKWGRFVDQELFG